MSFGGWSIPLNYQICTICLLFISSVHIVSLYLSIIATYPDWAPTHTHKLQLPSHPEQKIQVYKRAANFTSHILTCVCYIRAIYNAQRQQLISPMHIIFLSAEKLYKQISVSNQLYYSCDIWPITIETACTTYQTNTCADIIRIIHNVNIIRLLQKWLIYIDFYRLDA